MAVHQLTNSDLGYFSGTLAAQINGSGFFIGVIMLFALGAIWFSSVKKLFSTAAALVLVIGITATTPAFAFYETRDNPEFVEVRPNETAFLIPLVGANQNTQGQFGSREYLNSNKVAAKRIQIPHVLIRNNMLTSDYYVPAARLIVVDRTPYAREWVSSNTRGTSTADQGFRFESKDSIGIRTGLVISSFIREEDTATFLYWFGVNSVPGDDTDPKLIYASVSRGKSLAEIMDTVVRREAQAILAREYGNLNLVQAIAAKSQIMDRLREGLITMFREKGITIGTVGYAESLTFDNAAIQVAIDNAVIAERQAEAARILAPQLAVLERQANIALLASIPATLQRWNGQLPNLPSVISVPSESLGAVAMLSGMIPTQPNRPAVPAAR